jgi:hypothetical protein
MGRQNMTLEAMDQMPPNNLVQSEVGANWGTPTHWDFNVSNQCGQDGCMSFRQRAQNGTFSKRLDTVQCLQTYVSGFGNRSDLLLVSTQDLLASQTPPMPSKNNSLLFAGYSPGIGGPGYYWECGSTNTFDCRNPSPWIKDPSIIENWNVIGYKIDYCVISETDIQGACSVQYSLPIMISILSLTLYLRLMFADFSLVVCCANWCKCICIIYTALLYQNEADEPLASIGDAIRSFLSRPDPTTRSMCLIDKSMVSQNYTSRSFVSDKTVKGSRLKFRKAGQTRKPSSSDFWRTPHAQRFQRKHPRWLEAATRRRWCCTIISLA